MGDFVTGLLVGQNKADDEWGRYARNLEVQVADLQSQLRRETYQRTLNRADFAGLKGALLSLPPEIRAVVADAIRAQYKQAFVKRATELNSGPGGYVNRPDFAPTIDKIANESAEATLASINTRSPR
jgi:hypothetical protein